MKTSASRKSVNSLKTKDMINNIENSVDNTLDLTESATDLLEFPAAKSYAQVHTELMERPADLQLVKELTKDADLLDEANEALVEVQKLAIGSVAPEIEGVDVEGVAFKLSDYRGKVVLLDFWGFW